MIVEYDPAAREELAAATTYYAEIFPELADRLLDDLEAVVERLQQFPNAGAPIERSNGCRRWGLTRFPFQLIYRVESDTIHVYAFAHQKRRPGYWRKRTRR